MKLTKHCCYRASNINVLPAVLVTPLPYGFRVAFKWWRGHLGWEFKYERLRKEEELVR